MQTTNRVTHVLWDIRCGNENQWCPFLTPRLLGRLGPPTCWYDSPSFLSVSADEDDEADTREMLGDIVDEISNYRKNELFIPHTRFHRKISMTLTNILKETCKNERGKHAVPKWSTGAGDFYFQRHVDNEVCSEHLPDHTLWHGRSFIFKAGQGVEGIDKIMRGPNGLCTSGVLDCTVPGTVYCVGCQVVTHGWSLRSTYVCVGYLVNISKMTDLA